MGIVLRYAQLHEVADSRFRDFPLFPNVNTKSPSQPLVPSLHRCLHARYPEVAQPSPDVDLYILHHLPDIYALTAGSQFFQFGLGFLQGLCVYSDVGSKQLLVIETTQFRNATFA